MQKLAEFMTADHKACDARFALAEQAAYANNWSEADTAFSGFRAAMAHHFSLEEDTLFPALLAAGGPGGPVQMMVMEHKQMNGLLDEMAAVLARKDAKGYSGLAETLLIVLQQHNLKEEQILYPLAERLLSRDWDTLRRRMQSAQ